MRDGKPEVITVAVPDGSVRTIPLPCGGGFIGTASHARFRSCTRLHVHCTHCHRECRKHRNGWTCGKCPGTPS